MHASFTAINILLVVIKVWVRAWANDKLYFLGLIELDILHAWVSHDE